MIFAWICIVEEQEQYSKIIKVGSEKCRGREDELDRKDL